MFPSGRIPFLVILVLWLRVTTSTVQCLAAGASRRHYYLVTGANQGQGLALCQRILKEHYDTHVFLCSRNFDRGLQAAAAIGLPTDRVDVIPLDVTDESSVKMAVTLVQAKLLEHNNNNNDGEPPQLLLLDGLVSNAGILWDHSLQELLDVCTIGVRRVLDGFIPFMKPDGKVIVVSSGLAPLLLSFSKHSDQLLTIQSWDEIEQFMQILLKVEREQNGDPWAYEEAGFSGGPFAESVPDFHRYGLAKMLADAYMLHLSRRYPTLQIHSVDPGLVYTNLIGKMPKYAGKPMEETGAKTPHEGVEVHMRLLFGGGEPTTMVPSGQFHAINKQGELKSGPINQRPDVP